jgi:NADPH-dependent glutamate synthase beta subunit-like oxidoreductase
MSNRRQDLTRPADLHHESFSGPLRRRRPEYVDLLPPCNDRCPAGENIQAWLAAAQAGKFREAWEILTRDNPMPAIHGRVCYHPCEDGCNRTVLDGPVSIHGVERFLGDKALEEGWPLRGPERETDRRVLVVGAGPSGLSVAYHLRRMGHEVEIREAGPVAGGMMHFGIPAYRLPRAVLDAEVKRIEDIGVRIVLNHKVEDLLGEKESGGFHAAFVAIGAHLSKRVDIPARDAGKIFDAVGFLKSVEEGEAPKLGRRVAIYGGGNTAMDAARVAKRLGATEALIIYRRDREHMPAHPFEADEAIEEGVKINWLRTIREIDQSRFTVEIMEVDENGRPQPTGRFETLEADSLILALGQNADTGFLQKVPGIDFEWDGTVIVGPNMMTGHPGLFAGGDMVPSERTVTTGVGHGKQAARHIDAWLRGETYEAPPRNDIVTADMLRPWFATDAERRDQATIDEARRQVGFEEVKLGLSQDQAVYEAMRCLSCGNCFECDGCFGACPEDAVVKLGPGRRYRFDYDLCTGCAVCFEQCPCYAIRMVAEPSLATATEPAGEAS